MVDKSFKKVQFDLSKNQCDLLHGNTYSIKSPTIIEYIKQLINKIIVDPYYMELGLDIECPLEEHCNDLSDNDLSDNDLYDNDQLDNDQLDTPKIHLKIRMNDFAIVNGKLFQQIVNYPSYYKEISKFIFTIENIQINEKISFIMSLYEYMECPEFTFNKRLRDVTMRQTCIYRLKLINNDTYTFKFAEPLPKKPKHYSALANAYNHPIFGNGVLTIGTQFNLLNIINSDRNDYYCVIYYDDNRGNYYLTHFM